MRHPYSGPWLSSINILLTHKNLSSDFKIQKGRGWSLDQPPDLWGIHTPKRATDAVYLVGAFCVMVGPIKRQPSVRSVSRLNENIQTSGVQVKERKPKNKWQPISSLSKSWLFHRCPVCCPINLEHDASLREGLADSCLHGLLERFTTAFPGNTRKEL